MNNPTLDPTRRSYSLEIKMQLLTHVFYYDILEEYYDGKSHRDKIEVLQQTMLHVEYSKL